MRIGLQPDSTLGTPSDADKTRAGWYPSVLAGSAHGTVLMDGHTYHDDSAVFKMAFAQTVQVGMDVRLSCASRPVVAYRVSELRLDLTPDAYPSFVESRRLYAADGPPRLVLVTCTGWDARGPRVAAPRGPHRHPSPRRVERRGVVGVLSVDLDRAGRQALV